MPPATISCDICGEPVELADDLLDCEGCWRSFASCCSSAQPDFCVECVADGEAPDEEDL